VLVLALFSLVAGAATAVSPCVLPILPALLSAGAAGGKRRPFGIVLGLAVTFTVTIVGLAEVASGVGLGDQGLRYVAIAVLFGFGAALFAPALAARLEAPLSRVARFGPRDAGDGFWSGLGVGAALGFVYAPCAGPILAAVISVSAASGNTILVGASYAIGTAAVLLLVCLLGRRVLAPLRGPGLQRALGAIMVVTAVLMAFQVDIRFQETIADKLPAGLVNPANGLETSAAVQDRLNGLRGKAKFETARQRAKRTTGRLPVYGDAPDFVGTQRWFNTESGKPLTLASLRGRVVLVDFWTYTCINCIRTLPYLKAWDARYRTAGLTIVGVHSPEFSFEKNAGNVARAIRSDGIRYPVVQDNDLATWGAWGNQVWPAHYLIDAQGRVRGAVFGEGSYEQTERDIRGLLAEAGRAPGTAMATPRDPYSLPKQATPETYLGAARTEGFTPAVKRGTTAYDGHAAADLAPNQFSLDGIWKIGDQAATAVQNASLSARVTAKSIYLVLSPGGSGSRRVRVSLDGGPPRTIVVTTQRLYTLASLAKAGEHALRIDFEPGTSGFAFTFG
jgi:cytochrome c biogenesis protein CcdA/thiol-disulfide isomerase/thioredoxin